jgi:hypothetical protein
MAVRIPLKVVGSGASFSLQRCTAAEITQIVDHMIRKYGQSPSATLAVGSGNLGNITDTRLQAGAGTTDSTNFDTTGELDDVSGVTVTLNKILGAFYGTNAPTITRGTEISNATNTAYSFPCYIDDASGDAQSVREFDLDDMLDTFWHPAANRLVSASISQANNAGTYTITTSATPASGFTVVSTTPVFTDTRADASAYTAAGLLETLDQPTTITNYYLHQVSSVAGGAAMPFLAGIKKGETVPRVIPRATLVSQLMAIARYGAINEASYRIQYAFGSSTSGYNTRATAIDTKLNSSAYLTNEVYTTDYRAQEVPAGSAATVTTYNFAIRKA